MNLDTDNIPPKLAQRILNRILRDDLAEEVLGDLDEKFYQTVNEKTHFKAKLNYWYQVINYLRPFAIKKQKTQNSIHIAMFRNNLKIAWRTMLNQKIYSVIKLGGFAIGIAAFILISLFVKDELSYDQHYSNKDRIYRLLNVYSNPSNSGKGTAFPAQIAEVIRDNFPEVEKAARLIPYNGWWDAGDNQFRPEKQNQSNYEEGFAYADQELLEILEIPMIYGDQTHALTEPNSLVISKQKADKYFPNEDPVGKTVFLNEDKENPFLIGGVMADFPKNAHLQFDFLITLTGKEFWPGEQTNWCCWNYNPYLLLKEGTDSKQLEEKLLLIRDNYIVKYEEDRGDADVEDTKKYFSLELQPVADIHLKGKDVHDGEARGEIKIVWLFMAIAGFILVLACINFINLSTAKSANRAKEVGLKKVMGSHRSYLIRQFLTESMLYSVISVALGIIVALVLLPFFNELSGKSLTLPLQNPWVVPILAAFIVMISLVAGTYPSFYLSSFKPIDVLKGSLSRGVKSSTLRGVMVVFQFTTSIVLIVGALMVHRQMDYILNKKVGFDKDQVIMIQGANTLGKKMNPFKDELMKLSGIENVALSSYFPIAGSKRDQNQFWIDGRDKLDKGVGAQRWSVDKQYINTMGIKLIEGRGFEDMVSDSSSIIINQTMAKKLNLKNPIGSKIYNWQTWNVIGVVEDFHFESMRDEIGPLSMCAGEWGSVVSVKANTDNMAEVLANVENTWQDFMPNQPIRYAFLDETFERMYEDVKRTGNVFTVFAVLAIIVACLGLFGLTAFMVEQRSKEISIRKVLGAPMVLIVKLLTFNFLKLIAVSLFIACPIAWYLMQMWLNDFEYRVEITWTVFALAGFLVALIAMITVSRESIKAALLNPADGLRSE